MSSLTFPCLLLPLLLLVCYPITPGYLSYSPTLDSTSLSHLLDSSLPPSLMLSSLTFPSFRIPPLLAYSSSHFLNHTSSTPLHLLFSCFLPSPSQAFISHHSSPTLHPTYHTSSTLLFASFSRAFFPHLPKLSYRTSYSSPYFTFLFLTTPSRSGSIPQFPTHVHFISSSSPLYLYISLILPKPACPPLFFS